MVKFRPSEWSQTLARQSAALLAARGGRREIIPPKIQRNPLKRLISDEGIQGNPRKSKSSRRRFRGERARRQGNPNRPPCEAQDGAEKRPSVEGPAPDYPPDGNSTFSFCPRFIRSPEAIAAASLTAVTTAPAPSQNSALSGVTRRIRMRGSFLSGQKALS
jgi:hypothetical protein